jgi:cytochrome c
MLVLALSPQWWAAYNTQNGTLAKLWKGGVKLQGTIYTTKHGPQPTSEGKALLDHYLDRDASVWQVWKDGQQVTATVQYAGHKLQGSGIVLQTKLMLPDGKTITVEEQPELLSNRAMSLASANAKGKVTKQPAEGLGREFKVVNGQGYEVKLFASSGEMTSGSKWVVTGGTFKATERRELLTGPEPVTIETGWLTLANDQATIIIHPVN